MDCLTSYRLDWHDAPHKMPKLLANKELVVFAAILGMGYVFMKLKSGNNQPNAEEQAWLESMMATPRSNLTLEEQKWLDKQIQDTDDAERLDDARQVRMVVYHYASRAPSRFLPTTILQLLLIVWCS